MDSNDDKNRKILLITVIIALLVLCVYKLLFENKKIEKEKIDTKTISLVSDASDFYTVSSCVSKILNYLSIDDKESIISLLTEEYKKENNVNINNLYSFLKINNNYYNFNARKMYTQRMSKNLYKFYIYGLIEEESIDTSSIQMDYYIIIVLDKKNMTFVFEPYDGKMFK